MSAVGIAQSAVLGGDPGAWGAGLGLVAVGLLLGGTVIIRHRRTRATHAGDREAARLAGRVYRSEHAAPSRWTLPGAIAAAIAVLAGVGLLGAFVYSALHFFAPEVLP